LPSIAPAATINYLPLSNVLTCNLPGQNYQWGYDDMTTGEPTTLIGEMGQFYVASTTFSPSTRAYWVEIADPAGCKTKVYYTLPTAVTENIADQVILFPNPTSDVLNVILPSSLEAVALRLTDIAGKEIQAPITSIREQQFRINLQGLSSGVYFLQVQTTSGAFTTAIIRQ
jgi:hypothetical protein